MGLERPLDQLDLTKMLAESLEPEEQERSEETSPSGDAWRKPSRLRNRPRKQGTPNTFFHRRNRKRNPRWKPNRNNLNPKGNRMNRNGFSVGLIASPGNYGWRRRSATNLKKRSPQLRSQVDQVPAAVQQDGNPVAHIKKESELNKVAELAERRLQFAEDMEDALLDNPERVEKVLRQQGVSRKEQVVSG